MNDVSNKDLFITTIDNPFNPFEQFKRWLNYDEQKGYHTCGRLALLAHTSDYLSDYENDVLIDRAMCDMLDIYGTDIYRIVTPKDCTNW